MPRLLVMRHAKSDWGAGMGDHERPLNDRGRRTADAMGQLLRDVGQVPDLALTSTAERARTTVERAASAGDWATPIEAREALYLTSPEGALHLLSEVDDAHATVLLVGHEPTWSDLVHRLTGGSVRMATATIVGVDVGIRSWGEAPSARGEIAFVLPGRLFAPA